MSVKWEGIIEKYQSEKQKGLEGWDHSLTTGLCSFFFLSCPFPYMLALQTNPSCSLPTKPASSPCKFKFNSGKGRLAASSLFYVKHEGQPETPGAEVSRGKCAPPPGSWVTLGLTIYRKCDLAGPGKSLLFTKPQNGGLSPIAPYGDWEYLNKTWGIKTTELHFYLGPITD